MIAYPVLGPEGWVVTAQKKLDNALADMYASNASQSFMFPGMVSSIPKVVKDFQGNLEGARRELQTMIETCLRRYFPMVEVSVKIHDTNDAHRGELVLSAKVTEDSGDTAQLYEVMTNKGSVTRQYLAYQE